MKFVLLMRPCLMPGAFVHGLLKYVVTLVIFALSFHLRLHFASFYDYGDVVCPKLRCAIGKRARWL